MATALSLVVVKPTEKAFYSRIKGRGMLCGVVRAVALATALMLIQTAADCPGCQLGQGHDDAFTMAPCRYRDPD
jgi:hypothetical protein